LSQKENKVRISQVISASSKAAKNIQEALRFDNFYKIVSFATLVVFIFAAFAVSLAAFKFDLTKILEAQFWVDFSFTFGGGLFIKSMFSKYGSSEGHRNAKVVAMLKEVEVANTTIETNGWLIELKEHVRLVNLGLKLARYRTIVFHKISSMWFLKRWRMKRLLAKKEGIILAEQLLERKRNEEDCSELEKELNERNFDIESLRVRRAGKIREDELRTGFSAGNKNEKSFSFNEFYQIIGKSLLFSTITLVMTLLLAVIDQDIIKDIDLLSVLVAFGLRVVTFVMNAGVGFVNAKNAIEIKKLLVLQNIKIFLSTFIEMMREKEATIGYVGSNKPKENTSPTN